MSTYTEKEKTLLQQIVEKGLRQVKPIIGLKGIVYEDIEDIIDEPNWPKVRNILWSLAKKGALRIKEKHKALFCPTCNSVKIYSKYVCLRCSEDNITQVRLIEHSLCGYTGSIEDFTNGTRLLCPNCETDFGELNGILRARGILSKNESIESYKVIGSSFICESCGNRFDRPSIQHICQNCGRGFDYKNAVYRNYYEFEVPEVTILSIQRGQNIRVLLVEGNLDEATIILKALRDEGKTFSVAHVNTGEKALEKINSNRYDIILLDYLLPHGMNGIDILRQIRGKKDETPVIMVSGADDRETAVEAMKLGASDYLLKSVELYKKLPNIIKQLV